MQANYSTMKSTFNVYFDYNDKNDKYDINTAFKKLRPHSPFELTELLDPNFNPKKDLSRKSPKEIKEYYLYNNIIPRSISTIDKGTLPHDARKHYKSNTQHFKRIVKSKKKPKILNSRTETPNKKLKMYEFLLNGIGAVGI